MAMTRLPILGFILTGLIVGCPLTVMAQFPPDSFTNLKVLPRTIHRDTLVTMMAGFTRALGVRCTFCHVGEEGRPLETYNFASDEKPAKVKARAMLEMVGKINGEHLAGLAERAAPALRVECFTCHRGVREPRALQEILRIAYQSAGIDSAVTAYNSLRTRYYGRAAYDFGEVALADVADRVIPAARLADAERLHELNVQHNPNSVFARTSFMRVSLLRAFAELSADSGAARHAALKTRFGVAALPEPLVNNVGYALLRQRMNAQAVEVFKLNVAAYPQSANVYDSLGEAYAAAGNIPEAIRSYERSLQLNPQNTNAATKLTELRRRGRG